MKIVATLPLLAALVNRASGAGEGQWFSYFEKGGLGPNRWALLRTPDNQCGGGLTPDNLEGITDGMILTGEKWSDYGQSPVDVVQEDCEATWDYQFEKGTCTFEQLDYSISNNGVKVQPKAGTSCTFGKMHIPHFPATDEGTRPKFTGLQFHIHTSSEHTLDKKDDNGPRFYPAELHIVHAAEDGEGNPMMPYAVWGAFIDAKQCDESAEGCKHDIFENYLVGWEAKARETEATCAAANLPSRRSLAGDTAFKPAVDVNGVTTGTGGCYTNGAGGNVWEVHNTTLTGHAPDLYKELIAHKSNYGSFTYKGGLTTPPCTQIVNWNLMDEPILLSPGQLARLQKLIWCYVETDPACNHATSADVKGSTSRPPLPVTEQRKVIHRCPATGGCGGGAVCKPIADTVKPAGATEEFQKPAPKAENPNTKEGQCNKAWTQGCPEDKRANPNMSPNLKANAAVWNDFEGYWVGQFSATDRDGVPLTENFINPNLTEEIPYDRSTVTMFVNRTITETLYYEHIYYVYAPADSTRNSKLTGVDFCTLPKLVGSLNVKDTGAKSICGETGWAHYAERFGAATHEKDGIAKIFKGTGRYKNTTEGNAVPVGGNSIYIAMRGKEMKHTETLTFLNENRTKVGGSGQLYLFKPFEPYLTDPHEETFTYFLDQVGETEFTRRLKVAYLLNNVPYYDQFVTGEGCLASQRPKSKEKCPTASEYAAVDPRSTNSPYDEGATASGWFIAVMVILGVSILLALAYWWHTIQIKKQKERISRQFARRVAETIKVEGAHNQLTAEALEEEFKRIDTDHSGYLSKSELKAFVNSGKIGQMTDSDFNALFAALDVDGNGTVDFTEFCAFMAQCGQVYDEVEEGLSPEERRRSIAKRMSSRGMKDEETPFNNETERKDTAAE